MGAGILGTCITSKPITRNFASRERTIRPKCNNISKLMRTVITKVVSHHTQQLLTLFYSEAVQLQYWLMVQSCYRHIHT